MVQYYGRHSCKIFIRAKPVSIGIKLQLLYSSTGYPFNIELYCGKSKDNTDFPLVSRVLKKMLSCVVNSSCHALFIDNFFTSHDLLADLREYAFLAIGTVKRSMTKEVYTGQHKPFRQNA